MKMSCVMGVVLIGLISYSTALVHYKKLEKGEKGCKLEGKDIEVGGKEKDPNTCGVYVCQNKQGDSLIHYCQIPAPFQHCKANGVSTVTDFPECCWMCVTYVSC
ncbi:hypothetical protein KR093_009514 [Drosophila rubida]|uniref:Single domain-containing protein n=1 Tax=Drosophila rubida TaxID=30044 RepID=A0AAD4PKQ2_9MUSC|nr:hypothetical protein KR093_009514 [Drosophila rubida]